MAQDWLWMSAAALGRGINSGEIDPVSLTEAYLEAISDQPVSASIYSAVTADRARAEAKSAADRARLGLRKSRLDGVPISWKDLFDSKDARTEAGSALLAGRVPERDATALATATTLGLVCLGKTHMSELAFSGLGLNPVTATPPCIHDPDQVPGGSSSGAAASVAFGLACAAIGSDTGGSVRIPSAWNDLVGLKTTLGRVPVTGTVPLCPSFDTIGPLCRSVEDAALLLAALDGSGPVDLGGASIEGARFLDLRGAVTEGQRDAPAAAFKSAVERMQAAGALVERAEFPELEAALSLSPVLFAAEAYATWADEIEAAPQKMYSQILERFRGGRDIAARDYIDAWQNLHRFRAAWKTWAAGYDAVILPTCPILPPDREKLLRDDAYYASENLLALRNTRIGNLFGLSGLTLPTGVPSCGIMLLGQPFGEARLLRLGAAVEQALS